MATTPALLSIDEYLNTSYKPDVHFVELGPVGVDRARRARERRGDAHAVRAAPFGIDPRAQSRREHHQPDVVAAQALRPST